jgi:RNA polymerase primary sigma factor
MILGLCESPLTFQAIIEWSTALNNGEMQLREILDLDAMLSKDPAPESLSDDEDGDDDGEISEKTAGPSFKDEDEVEEEPEAGDEDEDSLVERRARRGIPPHRQTWCRRASARPASPRRKWSKPTCAS